MFTIRPHADPSVIKIELEGVDKLSVDQTGELVCQIGEEALRLAKPVAFQQIDGARIDVPVFYEINDHWSRLSSRNLLLMSTLSSLIQLLASTYLGGWHGDACKVILATEDGIYVAGTAWSDDFPTIAGCFQTAYGGGDTDIFISHFDSQLTTLISSTYVGGSDDDYLEGHSAMEMNLDGDLLVCAGSYFARFSNNGWRL